MVISASRLTSLLQQGGQIGSGVRVSAIEGSGSSLPGLLGATHRLKLTYSPADADGPGSLVLKVTGEADEFRHAFGRTEAQFYKHRLAEACSLETPQVYGAGPIAADGPECLLLEDLGTLGFVRQIDGCSPEQAIAAIRECARLHAHWWDQPLDDDLGWIQPASESSIGRFCRYWLRSYGGQWPDVLGPIPGILTERIDSLMALLGAGPSTVVHGDFHSHNLSFAGLTGRPRIIDFQFVQHASGMIDVARFLGTSLTIETRRSIERSVLESYERAMRRYGVEEFSVERHLDQFRAALLWNLAPPLALYLIGVLTRNRPWPERFPILERCIAAIEDWKAQDLMT